MAKGIRADWQGRIGNAFLACGIFGMAGMMFHVGMVLGAALFAALQ